MLNLSLRCYRLIIRLYTLNIGIMPANMKDMRVSNRFSSGKDIINTEKLVRVIRLRKINIFLMFVLFNFWTVLFI